MRDKSWRDRNLSSVNLRLDRVVLGCAKPHVSCFAVCQATHAMFCGVPSHSCHALRCAKSHMSCFAVCQATHAMFYGVPSHTCHVLRCAKPHMSCFWNHIISSRKIHDTMTCKFIHVAIISVHFLLLTVEVMALGQLLTVLLLSPVQDFSTFLLKIKITKVLVIAQFRNQNWNIWVHQMQYKTFIRMSTDEEAKLIN
jgi:hypothetical protein